MQIDPRSQRSSCYPNEPVMYPIIIVSVYTMYTNTVQNICMTYRPNGMQMRRRMQWVWRGCASGSACQARRVVNSDRHPTNQASKAKKRRGHGTGLAAAPIMAVAPKSISWNAATRRSGAASRSCVGAGVCSLVALLSSSWTIVGLATV
jgi:hypothetical protein